MFVRRPPGPPPQVPWNPGLVITFCLFAIVTAFLGVRYGVLPTLLADATSDWTETPCTVLRSEVVWSETGSGAETSSSTSLVVEYEYSFGGASYRSDRVDYSPFTYEDAVLKRFPAQQPSVCWVDPDHPGRSVLLQGQDAIDSGSGAEQIIAVLSLLGILTFLALATGRPDVSMGSAWNYWFTAHRHWIALGSLAVPGLGIAFGVKKLREGETRQGIVYLTLAAPWAFFLVQWGLFWLGLDLP